MLLRSLGLLFCLASPLSAQTASSPVPAQATPPTTAPPPATTQTIPPAPDQPAFTLRTNTRLVLTDVTVTDHDGNPVHNLPRSAFHIVDGSTPQEISSFEEHTSAQVAANTSAPSTPQPKGVYNNDFILHAPPVLDVIILDISNLQIEDQMYLNFQLTKFLDALPAGQQLAIYERGGNATILLQNFTADRKLLLDAVHRGIPRLPPTGREYISELDTLQQIGTYLTGLPGRKNILWFSGGSTLFLQPDNIPEQDVALTRRIYDNLEANRIAVYPIDARGLTTDIGTKMRVMSQQHLYMEESAEATGGHAFYNTNGLQQVAARITNTGADFYTLTYSPRDYKEDKKWHKVHISLDIPGYDLSYRRGYFADGVNNTPATTPPRTLRQLIAGGTSENPSGHAGPIIFEARVLPSSDPAAIPPPQETDAPAPKHVRGGIPYSIHYDVPADALSLSSVNGRTSFKVIVAALVFNQYGSVVDRRVQQFTLNVNMARLQAAPHAQVPLDQQLEFTKGQLYVLLAVVDVSSGRSGNVQIAMDVPPEKKLQK